MSSGLYDGLAKENRTDCIVFAIGTAAFILGISNYSCVFCEIVLWEITCIRLDISEVNAYIQ